MLLVAKRFKKKQLTVRVNPENLTVLESIGGRLMRNTSEMVDRAIEFYIRNGAGADTAAVRAAKDEIDQDRHQARQQ